VNTVDCCCTLKGCFWAQTSSISLQQRTLLLRACGRATQCPYSHFFLTSLSAPVCNNIMYILCVHSRAAAAVVVVTARDFDSENLRSSHIVTRMSRVGALRMAKLLQCTRMCHFTRPRLRSKRAHSAKMIHLRVHISVRPWVLDVCLFAWGLTALSAQIGYIAP